ncbi:ComF family protein [Paraburkholderia sp. BCC1884]|uniref:ComF family protein n=1 Tax=Paraburkholderia sp. BCC1884 TaxID=2562668 RepID=UPI0011845865|nr:ComF family protein [Paraburkholderia sp. BCC1884]
MAFRPFSLSSDTKFARFARGVQSAWPHIVNAALPNLCALCGNLSHDTLCAACDQAYWNESRLRCVVCAVPLSGLRWASHARYHCADCIAVPPPFDATFALADYRAPLDTLAVGLKFRARLALAREFGLRLARVAQDAWHSPLERPDVIAPVPLAGQRLVERGYNQAWEIAKPLARALNLPGHATLVQRVIHTAPQSRLDLDARRLNVGRAFKVAAQAQGIRGMHVGIVDDVMTTGATLEALARTLKAAGARRVTNFVALRTPKN